MSSSLKTLISKLNGLCRKATEQAASLCMGRGHYEIDLEHLLLAILEQPGSDLAIILKRSQISLTGIARDLEHEIGGFKQGNTRTPVFSLHIQKLLEQAWLIASLDTRLPRIRSVHLLLALLTEPDLAQLAKRCSSLLAQVRLETLKHHLDEITEGSSEAAELLGMQADHAGGAEGGAPDGLRANGGKTPALDQFTTNLTQRARDGKLDPVIGRDAEIRQAIDILMRRRQNNPILTGEAGVGKTAVVEGLALRIAAGDVPLPLQAVEVHTLDMGLLQAGASVKGEFENRLKNVIDEVKQSLKPIILFIDEAHTMIGAGGQSGQNDAANLLKPALARGELRTLAATTWAEYKKYFEKDAALARRFQVIKVDEPSEGMAAAMLRGMVPLMEKHFGIRVLDEAVTEAVRLSHRYISGRQLPDKAIGVLDTACAKVALGQSATPAQIDDLEKRILREKGQLQALAREAVSGMQAHTDRIQEIKAEIAQLEDRIQVLRERFESEKKLVSRILEKHRHAEQRAHPEPAAPLMSAPAKANRKKIAATERPEAAEIAALIAELSALQGESPMVPLQVDAHVVAEIVAAWTGIPLGKMVKNEINTVLSLKPLLQERVIGQDHVLESVAQRVRTARANLEDPNKPKGVFLFVGPSGVGKTETALALADILYGGEKKLVTINMSEYQEAHSVSGLKGSPPGYVGYGEGGVLTEAVRRNPYSVVLLDEVEKAHPDVLELFFQVFDKGVLDDAEGREIDFRNTLIILTSNVGSSQIMQACLNQPPENLPLADDLAEALRPVLFKHFKPAFLGRMKVVPYYPISDEILSKIIELKLQRIRNRVAANHKAEFAWDDKLVAAVLARCTEVDSGARNVDHILNGSLLPEIAEFVLSRMAEGKSVEKIKISADKQGQFKYSIKP